MSDAQGDGWLLGNMFMMMMYIWLKEPCVGGFFSFFIAHTVKFTLLHTVLCVVTNVRSHAIATITVTQTSPNSASPCVPLQSVLAPGPSPWLPGVLTFPESHVSESNSM